MKAVVLQVTDEELDKRRRLGLDHFDEMWEGVLHMAPSPLYEHQRIVQEISEFLGALCKRRRHGVLVPATNVFNEASQEQDYRIPDFSFVAKGREHILARDGIRGAGPDAVIEVRSPYDETYEKFPFFARLGVREVIVIDRDTKQFEIYRLAGAQYVAVQADANQSVRSEVLKVRFGCTDAGRVMLEDVEDPTSRVEI
jgi:Uma2 family endonuclease